MKFDRTRNVEISAIVNMTDDSFFSGSRYMGSDISSVIATLLDEGASSIDIGACSTRPGSAYVSPEQEWERLFPALDAVRRHFPHTRVSVDTFRADIVRKVFDTIGPFVVNDISAGEEDAGMLRTVADLGLEYIAMHKRGVPSSMQSLTDYGEEGVVAAVRRYFEEFTLKAEDAGIREWALDPGFGFAKTVEQNYELLEGLPTLAELGHRLYVGVSRKSFIYKPLGLTPETCLEETQKVHMRALELGADILRVHDVARTVRTLEDYRNGTPS